MCVTEKTAQNLELAGHPEKGEKLRQDVSNVLYNTIKKNRQQRNKYRKKRPQVPKGTSQKKKPINYISR